MRGLGREALAERHFVSASEHLSRAAVTYHFAKYLFVQDMEQMRAAHMKAVECLNLALPHLDPPGERVLIPYSGKHLAATLRKPKDIARPPIVLMTMGLDSTKEELLTFEMDFLRRGMAILAFDGPGQGEAEYDFPIRYDYENVVGPGDRLADREPARHRHEPHRHLGHQPGRLLRAAHGRLRKAHPRGHRQLRPLQLGRAVGEAPRPHARCLYPSQPQRDRSRGARERRSPCRWKGWGQKSNARCS